MSSLPRCLQKTAAGTVRRVPRKARALTSAVIMFRDRAWCNPRGWSFIRLSSGRML
jgi:hypothetical protein